MCFYRISTTASTTNYEKIRFFFVFLHANMQKMMTVCRNINI